MYANTFFNIPLTNWLNTLTQNLQPGLITKTLELALANTFIFFQNL